MMTLEEKKIRAETIGSYIQTVAIVIGGIWVLFTFTKLKQIYHSEAAAAMDEARLVALNFSIEEKQFPGVREGAVGIEFSVLAENTGSRRIDLDLSDPELFSVVRLTGDSTEKTVEVSPPITTRAFNYITPQAIRSMTSASVAPGTSVTLKFYVEVEESGVYFAYFLSPIPVELLKDINRQEKGDLEEKTSHKSTFGAQLYFPVSKELSK